MRLVLPDIRYKDEYLRALEEGKDEVRHMLRRPSDQESFEDFVTHLLGWAQGLYLPEGWVPSTELWLIDGNEYIGTVSIRHRLTEKLLRESGHSGYYIRPSKRKMGYGKKILAMGLEKAKELGLTKVLVTCDENNIGSRKVIEANRGVLEDIVEVKNAPRKRRYWISL